jgi:hypothetical protein
MIAVLATLFLWFAAPRAAYADAPPPNDMIVIPEAERPEYIEHLQNLSPEAAQGLAKTGKLPVRILEGMLVYEMATGAQSFINCYRLNDPSQCRQYYDSLRDPVNLAGIVAFSETSNLVTSQWVKRLGAGALSRATSSSAAMTAALAVQSIFSQALRDPRDLLKQDFWDSWSMDLATMLATVGIISSTKPRLDQALRKLINLASRPEFCVRFRLAAAVGERPTLGPIQLAQSGQYGRVAKLASGVGEFVAFTAIMGGIKPGVDRVHNEIDFDGSLANPPSTPPKTVQMLDERLSQWGKYRHALLGKPEPTMMLYRSQLKQFDDQFIKRAYFYNWIAAGMNNSGLEWELLRSAYYTNTTTPAQIENETDRYLTDFFCGVAPSDAFRPSANIHGVPVPFRSAPRILSYRVVPVRDPSLCGNPSEASAIANMKAAVLGIDFSGMAADANSKVADTAVIERDQMVDRYERETDRQIRGALAGSGKEGHAALPSGVIPSYEAEERELRRFLSQTQDPQLVAEIKARLEGLQAEQTTAQAVLDYVNSPPTNRVPPSSFGLDSHTDIDSQQAQAYYLDYILRQKDGFQ